MKTLGQIKTYIQDMYNDLSTKTGTRINSFLTIAFTTIKRELKTKWVNIQTQSITTVAAQQTYDLDARFSRLISVKATVGSDVCYPVEISNEDQWNLINVGVGANTQSDYPQYYFVQNGVLSLWPIPSGTNTTLTVKFRSTARGFVSTDFTDKSAGTVSITSNAVAVTGSGTAFAATDVGRYIRFDLTGDWYKIAAFTSTTAITLAKPFKGTTIAGGAYLLGTTLEDFPTDVSLLVAYNVLSKLFYARDDKSLGREYSALAEEELKQITRDINNNNMSPTVMVIESTGNLLNPNDYPLNLTD